MLHIETVEPGTFSLLKELMALPELRTFSLVGGTALSLQFGHRSSGNIDLFYHERFDFISLTSSLQKAFNNRFVYKQQQSGFGIFSFIDQIKVDIIHYPHSLIDAVIETEGIRMYSIADISAMKIQAILGRAKKKDFWDLYELLQHHPLQQLMEWHQQKFPSQMLAISIPHAITYFVDAEESEPPVSFKKQTWEMVKKGIQHSVSEFLR
jgi:hypothetical protein